MRWFLTFGAVAVGFLAGHAFAHHLAHVATLYASIALAASTYSCLREA